MSGKRPNKMQAYSAQTARIADEGKQVVVKPRPADETVQDVEQPPIPPVPEGATEVDPVQSVEAVSPQPHEATSSQPKAAAALQPQEAAKLAPLKRTSTSLYLSPAAHKVLRIHAAEVGVRSNRIYEDALRDYFAKHKLGNFDEINQTAP